jgi:glutamate dehydrogenase/leucine dehydrogenase
MDVFDRLNEHDYEKLVFCNEGPAGLRGIIAIHDTTLGPALGGVRMRPYETEEDALIDVLRLARGMTYKAAISGVNLGGGKSVIICCEGSRHTYPACLATPAVREIHRTRLRTASGAAYGRSSRR